MWLDAEGFVTSRIEALWRDGMDLTNLIQSGWNTERDVAHQDLCPSGMIPQRLDGPAKAATID